MGKKKAKRKNKGTGAIAASSIAVRKRRHLIEKQLLNGHVNQITLAASHGVSQQTICNDLKAISTQWLCEDIEKTVEGRRQSVRRQESIMAEAATEFARSKQAENEVSVNRKLCPVCKGEPDGDSEEQCPECLGQCRILIETTKTTSKPGNPKYLMVMHAAEKEIARLKGLHKQHPKQQEKPIGNTYNSTFLMSGSKVDIYENATTDQIIEAKRAIAALEQTVQVQGQGKIENSNGNGNQGAIIEGKVLGSKTNSNKENQGDEEKEGESEN